MSKFKFTLDRYFKITIVHWEVRKEQFVAFWVIEEKKPKKDKVT